MIIGADVGGTFTDLVAVDGDSLRTEKVPTSPVQSTAIALGTSALSNDRPVEALVHGTTVATNALLERSGARTILVTDAGFEDVLEIGRQDRPSLYDPFDDRAEPLVRRSDRYGISALDDLPDFTDGEAVAVAMIDGHENRAREQAIAAEVHRRARNLPVSLSSEVAPEFREFERCSTTVLNAYLTPITARYLTQLADDVLAPGTVDAVSVMRSSGGLVSLDEAAMFPAAILLSGPAGGAIAAEAIATALGRTSAISFDMGGTSTDVCRIDSGVLDVSYERSIDGYACRLPSVGVHTVGAGGGSVAWIDTGGALRVGPLSAGAHPGPASYGHGGVEATVTDANVVLGRIGPNASFGGSVQIDAALAALAVGRLASQLGMSTSDTAIGVLRIAEEVMAGAVRTVSFERGIDPAGSWLVAFGGAGGLHATSVARSLRMSGVIIPRHAGVFSAVGLLLAPPRADAVKALHLVGEDLSVARSALSGLEEVTQGQLTAAGSAAVATTAILDVRYLGQAHEIAVPWTTTENFDEVRIRFEELHEQRNGFTRPEDGLEILAVRCTAIGTSPIDRGALGSWIQGEASMSARPVVTARHGKIEAAVVARDGLAIGESIPGPAVIEETESTTYIDVDETATVASDGSLEVTW